MHDRRSFLAYFSGVGLTSTLFPGVLWAKVEEAKEDAKADSQKSDGQAVARLTREMLRSAALVAGLDLSDAQIDTMLNDYNLHLAEYADLRRVPFDNGVAPPLYFNPVVPGMTIDRERRPMRLSKPPKVERPKNLEDAAFWPVTYLAELIRTRQATSVELAEMYLARIQRHNPALLCVVTVTEELALRQAREADREIAANRYRGPLHGIPYGAKDICAARGYPTTWGAETFRTRVIDADSTVVARLNAAGAVLVAKLATGELALDDVWFGGQTKNPWDLSMGSQGSSCGPGSATASGLVGFSIGTETLGSIVEPSGICGVTGMRPSFGRISRHGVMAFSWSLDKTGPMCRSVEDCALVLAAIQGPDGKDLAVQDVPFNWDASLDIRKLRVGYLKAAFEDTRQTPQVNANDAAALEKIRSLGVSLIEVAMPAHANVDATAIMYGEATAALRDPVESQPAKLVRQDRVTKQNSYRLLPAADYFNAQRMRMLLMQEMAAIMEKVDVYIAPFDYGDYTPNPVSNVNTSVTNLTGQPCVAVPHGFNEKGQPTCLVFHGRVYGEAQMLALANAYQSATEWHLKHPKLG